MTIKKNLTYLINCCAILILVNTLSGCATVDKEKRIISLQKKRIGYLNEQVSRQHKIIGALKQQKINPAAQSNRELLRHARGIDKLIASKNWVDALKYSSLADKKYPNSVEIKIRRYKILNRMGLKKQAAREYGEISKLRASRQRGFDTRKL